MRARLLRAAVLTTLVLPVTVLLASTPAAACSEPGPVNDELALEDIDESQVIAIGQAEIVARTGPTWRWHRAGVVAFTEAWPLSDDADAVAETVWTINDGRDRGGDCYFGRDAGPIGSRQGFHALFEDGRIAQLATFGETPVRSIDAAGLTERYGDPVQIQPDAGRVEAALSPLTSERRATNLFVRGVAAVAIAALAVPLVRRMRAQRSLSAAGARQTDGQRSSR